MLTYSFDNSGNIPLYEQLYTYIKEDILAGRLQAGEKLPSKRPFARQLCISTITIENAYAQLATEGYILPEPRRGFFVADVGNVQAYKAAPKHEEDFRFVPQPAPEKSWFADFAGNQTAAEHFPFSTWARLSRRILSDRREELLINTPGGGSRELRTAIAEYLEEFRGMTVRPEQVLIGAGTEYLYSLLLQLLGLDLTYATENPGYRKAAQIIESFGVKHIGIPLDSHGIIPDEIRKAGAQVVHVTPSHHFPTGITMPVSRRTHLLDWANEAPSRCIIEDDYDSEFRLSGRMLQPLAAMDNTGRVIYMNTFTKSLASTIRVSYMVLPEQLLKLFRQKLSFYSCTVSTFEQYTLAAFIREGHFEKHINRMRTMSRRKRDRLMKAFEAYNVQVPGDGKREKRVFISEEDAGLHFLMNIPLKITAGCFRERLEAAGIRMMDLTWYLDADVPLDPFQMRQLGDGKPEHTFIVNYSHVPEENIEEAVARIMKAADGV